MTEFEDGQTIDLDCGCELEYRGDLETWIVGGFCEEHDPTIAKRPRSPEFMVEKKCAEGKIGCAFDYGELDDEPCHSCEKGSNFRPCNPLVRLDSPREDRRPRSEK